MGNIKITAAVFACLCVLCACGESVKGVKTVKYENGLTSLLIRDENSLAASVAVFVRTGAIDEAQPSQAGLSHFIEHLMFKGSKNYADDKMSRVVENLGGYINAMTSNEFTMYYINIQKDGVDEAVKMLADAMRSPSFPAAEIDKERKVVIEEIQRHSDNPFAVLSEAFDQTIYRKSALRNSVIGTADVIANVSRDEIFGYYSSHYVPERMTVIVTGNFDKKRISQLIGETFGQFERKAPPAEPDIIEAVHSGEDLVKRGKVEVGYMISGFLGPDMSSDDIFIADVAANILGGGQSSRLYRVIKEEKHLVYSISASFSPVKGTGTLSIVSVFDPANIDSVKSEIKNQISKMASGGVTEEELARARLAVKTSWSFAFEQPFDIAYAYGYWNLMGRPDAVDSYIQRIDAITAQDVKNFLAKYYSVEKTTNVAMLPEKDKVKSGE